MKHIIAIFLLIISWFSVLAQVKIEMQETNGVYEVPCEVNGLRLKFIFDTGASSVSLSLDMALFMLDNDYLDENDIYDVVTIVQADGTTFEAYKVILKTMNIGGFILKNVECIITPYQNAPLLLGQSAIQQLGRISIKDHYLIIDNQKNNYIGLKREIAILGLKQGSSYDICYGTLCEKYGEEKVNENLVNNEISALEVKDVYFIGQHFDEIEFYFDDNDLLNSVELTKYFPSQKLEKASKMRDELYSFLSKKYQATISHKQPRTNFIWYGLGYDIKDDIDGYPINIGLSKSQRTTQQGGEKPDISNGYAVILFYWPASHDSLFEEHPLVDDY